MSQLYKDLKKKPIDQLVLHFQLHQIFLKGQGSLKYLLSQNINVDFGKTINIAI